jgi:hypothetical protein
MGRGRLQKGWIGIHRSNKWLRAVFMLFFVILGIFLLSTVAHAATDLSIQVKDISNNTPVVSLPVVIKLTDIRTGMEGTSTEFIDASGSFVQRLEPGNWRVELQIFDPKSDWIDYTGQRVVYIQNQEPTLERTFYLIPIGALEGVVMLEGKGLVGEAGLEFQCSYSDQFTFPLKTDEFGSFKIPAVPAGKCRVTASAKDHSGWVDVDITKGELKSVKVLLNQTAISPGFMQPTTLLGGVGVITVLVIAYYLFRRKIKSQLKKELKEEEKNKKPKRRLFRRKTKAKKEESVSEQKQA